MPCRLCESDIIPPPQYLYGGCSDHSVKQFLSFDQFCWDGASLRRLKEATRGSNSLRTQPSLAEVGKAECCFCKGSLAPKPLLLQHSDSEALRRITAGHEEEKHAFLSSFLELFFPFGLQFSQKYQSNSDSNNTFGPHWLYLANLLKTRS